MGIFGGQKKTSDGFKTLTEREIQQRLYGHLRQPSVTGEIAEKVKEKHKAVSLTPLVAPKSSTLETPAKPAVTKTAHDLFVKPVSQESPVRSETTSSASAKASPAAGAPASKTSFDRRKNPNPLKPVLAGAGKALAAALTVLGGILGAIFKGLIRILTSINFKSPSVRRAAAWTLAAGLIAGIFVGIHFLNVSREAAMKQPYKPRPVEAKPAAVQAPAKAPAEAVSATPLSPAAVSDEAEKSAAEAPAVSSAAVPAAEKRKAETAAPKLKKGFGIQVATFALKEDGEKLIARLKGEGFPAFLKPMTRPNGRIFQSVYLGPYPTFQEAQLDLSRFKKNTISKPFQDAFVRSVS